MLVIDKYDGRVVLLPSCPSRPRAAGNARGACCGSKRGGPLRVRDRLNSTSPKRCQQAHFPTQQSSDSYFEIASRCDLVAPLHDPLLFDTQRRMQFKLDGLLIGPQSFIPP